MHHSTLHLSSITSTTAQRAPGPREAAAAASWEASFISSHTIFDFGCSTALAAVGYREMCGGYAVLLCSLHGAAGSCSTQWDHFYNSGSWDQHACNEASAGTKWPPVLNKLHALHELRCLHGLCMCVVSEACTYVAQMFLVAVMHPTFVCMGI